MFVLLEYVQLTTSLLNIFYTTSQFPRQVRLQKPPETHIKTFSLASVALIIWRSFIIGSRMLVFVLFALLYKSWLFVVIGFHYVIMFALVFYQMHISNNTKLKLIGQVVYTIVAPFVYIFDFCGNWLEGPSRYWYVMCYVPMYCENLLMSVLCMWYVTNTLNPTWYILPGCLCVIVMFPLGVLAQVTYYFCWHPTIIHIRDWKILNTWSTFREKVIAENQRWKSGICLTAIPRDTAMLAGSWGS